MNTKSFDKLMEDYKELNERIKLLTAQKEIIKDTLKSRLSDSNLESYENKVGRVSVWESERVSYPKAMLLKKYGEEGLKDCQKIIKTGGVRVSLK